MADPRIGRVFGRAVRRREDPRLITGTATYVDDIRLPNSLHVRLVRSPHAHARIKSIDTSQAAQVDGVVAVFTGDDLKDEYAPVPVGWSLPDLKVPAKYPLAVGKVCYQGEAVAAVVAETAAAARDAADLVRVEYEPMPAVVDPVSATADGAPVIWPEAPNNIAYRTESSGGDPDGALASAPHRLKTTIVQQRVIPLALEPRGVAAEYHPVTGELTVWTSTQIPHLVHVLLPAVLGMPETKVRIIAPEVGGGFGSKLNFYPEEILIPALARKLGRPVHWTEDRSENFVSTIHGRGQIQEVEVGFNDDGTITVLKLRIYADLGAYHQLLTPAIPTFTPVMMTGVYNIPNVAAEVIGVFTNKVPTDAYRGAGRPEATHMIERVMDLVARELDMDPLEVRRRNFIPADAFPFNTATGVTYDSGNYQGALEHLLELVDLDEFRRQQKEAREQGRLLGIGFSTYVEICGLAPSRIWGALGASIGGWESASVRVSAGGKVTVITGTSPHGQGHATSWSQIVAEELGVDIDDVEVLHGDTAVAPYGLDTYGSRSAAVGGTAVHMAAQRVRQKAEQIAAHLLEADPGDLELVSDDQGNRFVVKGAPQRSVSFAEVAAAAFTGHNLPDGMEPGLEATAFYDPENFTYPFGAHACIVEVDPEDGRVQVLRYVAVDDCGQVINPQIVDGQVHGGIAQGLGQALFEEAVYSPQGQLLTGTLTDYAAPTAAELPSFETSRTITPSPVNPLGVKGVGEAGTIAASSALVNAVCDALHHLGVRHIDMPLKPARVWEAIQSAQKGDAQ